jgi:phytol kinase
MKLILTVLVILVVLLISEAWWRHQKLHNEFSRKLVHITVGSFVAFWPFFLTWNEIKLLSVAFLLVVSISKNLHIFKAIHSVQRPTWGELYFALAVGGIAFVTHDKWIYMAALLFMSLADGLAAVIGVRYGKSQRYYIFKQAKSVAGTATFFVVAMVILIGYSYYAPGVTFQPIFILLAIVATIVENIAIAGLDNVFVPLFVAALLNFYH